MPMCALGWLMVALPADAGVQAYCGRGLPGRVPPSAARVGRVAPAIRHPPLLDRAVRRPPSGQECRTPLLRDRPVPPPVRGQTRGRAGGWVTVPGLPGAARPAVSPGHIPRIDGRDVNRPAESPPLTLQEQLADLTLGWGGVVAGH